MVVKVVCSWSGDHVVDVELAESQVGVKTSCLLTAAGFPENSKDLFYLTHNGRLVNGDTLIPEDATVYLSLRILGGKGGFGSMLRAIGAQIEKTTNREACRDLSGRRLRDINEEKRLKNWIVLQAEREKEAEERKRQRLERMMREPKHDFHDPDYERARGEMVEKVHDAVETGLKAAKGSSSEAKRKGPKDEESETQTKKSKRLWWDTAEAELDASDISSDEEDDVKQENMTESSSSVTGSEKEDSLEAIIKTEPKVDVITDEKEDVKEKKKPEDLLSLLPPPKSEVKSELIEQLDLSSFNSAEELEAFGLDRLKSELSLRGLKCGGTLKERAQRLFSIKGLQSKDIDRSLLAKPARKK